MYEACDDIADFPRLVRLAERASDLHGDCRNRRHRESVEADVRRALAAMVDRGLMVSQADRFLSLALLPSPD